MKASVLERVMIQSYKSIARCNVTLRPLTLLVGPNGAGKSNFLDALRFTSDALTTTLDQAIRDRGGIKDVRRRSSGHPNHFGMRLELTLPDGASGFYAFQIGSLKSGYAVQREQCVVIGDKVVRFEVIDGELTRDSLPLPVPSPDRLLLVAASSYPEFRGVYDVLAGMAFYNLAPSVIRELQPPDAGEVLLRDGRNLASVIGRLEERAPNAKTRMEEYLKRLVPGLEGVSRRSYGARETLEFFQAVRGAKHPWRFDAASMSDGTLRAVGVLAALLQVSDAEAGRQVSVVGIEEPESALHPAGAGLLLDALQEASQQVQVLVTTHSPDLLDSDHLPTDAILAVRSSDDVTEVGPVDEAGKDAVRERLYTPGELLRADQLQPDDRTVKLARDTKKALQLFDS